MWKTTKRKSRDDYNFSEWDESVYTKILNRVKKIQCTFSHFPLFCNFFTVFKQIIIEKGSNTDPKMVLLENEIPLQYKL